MKLLVIFLSALVLAAQSKVADYAAVAGEEAGGIGPQDVFAKETEPRVGSPTDPEVERALEDGVYIPIVTRACNSQWCQNSCRQLGYWYGACINANTCRCYN